MRNTLFIGLLAVLLSGCTSAKPTVVRRHHFGDAYCFADPKFRALVVFHVPAPWKLSHYPEGGIAGMSSFRHARDRSAVLLVDAVSDDNAREEWLQDDILAALKADDDSGEAERVTSMRRLVAAIRDANPDIVMENPPDHDRAEWSVTREVQTSDGRTIAIAQISSPTRGVSLQACIPEDGFVVWITYHPTEDQINTEGVDLVAGIVGSYKKHGKLN